MADLNDKSPPVKAPKNRSRASGGTGNQAKAGDAQMGAALRSVYQNTVEESVPPEKLDRLSKLD